MQAFLKTVWQRRIAALSLGGLFAASQLLAQGTVPELPPALKQSPATTPPVTPQTPSAAPMAQPVAPQPTPELRPGLRDAIEQNRATREANRDNRQDAREQNRDNRELNRDTRANSIEPAGRADDRQERRERLRERLGFALNSATNGLRVENLQQNSTFAGAGFRNNDVILRVGDQRFNSNAAFYNWLTTVQPGQRFGITVLRDGREETVNWTPTEQWTREFNADYQNVAADQGTLGITIDAENSQAAIVATVAPGSLADRAGIRPRDQIDSLNGEKIRTAQEFLTKAARLDGKAQIDLGFTRVVTLTSVAKPLTEITIPLPDRREAPATLPLPVTPRAPQPDQSVASKPRRDAGGASVVWTERSVTSFKSRTSSPRKRFGFFC